MTAYRFSWSIPAARLLLQYVVFSAAMLQAAVPLITVPPSPQRASVGSTATFSVEASGTAPLSFAWFKGATQIEGATSSLLVLPRLTLGDAGDYSVRVSNSEGSATGGPARLTVNSAVTITSSLVANLSSIGPVAGSVTLTARLSYLNEATPTSLGFSLTLPPGWGLLAVGGANPPDIKPPPGNRGTLEFAFSSGFPPGEAAFTITVGYPAGLSASQTITSSMTYLTPLTTVQGAPLVIPFSATPPAAPSAPQVTPLGGTVVADVVNLTNTNARFAAAIVAGEATGGLAELRWGGRLIARDETIGAADTSVSFDLNTSNNSGLRTALAGVGPLTVNLVSAAGLSSATSPAGNLRTDFSSPVVEITADRVSLLQGQTSVVTFSLSESSPDFAADGITVSGGRLSGFSSVSATQYRATFTPSENSVEPGVITVGAGRFRDSSGNANATAAELRLVVDTNPQFPVISIGATPVTGVYGGAFEYRISATRNPIAFTATGLPSGLAIDPSSGLIRGTPRQTGVFSVALGASNAAGSGSATLSLRIEKAVLKVTAQDATRIFGAANAQFTVAYDGFIGTDTPTILRGLPVISTSANAGSNAGTYDLVPSGAESELYQIFYVNGRLTITPAPVVLTLANLAQVYTGQPLAPVVLTSVSGVPVALSYNGSSASPVNVGTYPVTATASGGNYSGAVSGEFVISRGTQFINLRLAPAGSVLRESGDPVQVIATSSAGLPVSLSVDPGGAASLDASNQLVVAAGATGFVTLRAKQAGNANVAASADAVLRLDVGKRNQQVSVEAVPPQRFGDGLRPLIAQSSAGLPVEFAILSGPGNLVGRDTLQMTGAGVIVIRARQTGDDTHNPAPDLTFEVSVAPRLQTIDFPALADVAYGTRVELASSSSSALPVSYQVVSGPAILSGSTLSATGVGTVVVRATQKGDEGTLPAQAVESSFNFFPRPLVVSAVSATRIFGAANPPLLLAYSGFAPGEGAEVFSAAPTVSTDAIASSAPGEYILVVVGGSAANYAITRANGKLTVRKAPQTISFPAISDQTVGNLPLQLAVSADSGRIPDLVLVSGPATLAGSSLALTGTGRVVVRASLPGDANYDAAPDVERTFSIFSEVVIVGLTSPLPNGAYTTGSVIPVQVVFSAPVVVTGAPVLALNAGASARASYAAGSGTKVLTFNYLVAAGDSAAPLDYTTTGSLTGGNLRGAAGAGVISTLPVPGGGSSLAAARLLLIDSEAPSLLRLEALTASGSYFQGQRIELRALVSEPLQAGGGLELVLSTGARVTLSPVAGEAQLQGSYLIGPGENTRLLNATGVRFAGGLPPRDPAGNALILAGVPPGAANLAGSRTISIGNSGPSVVITADRLLVSSGGTVALRFSTSEEVVGFGVEDVGVESGVLSGFSGSGREYSAVYTPVAGVKGEGRVWVEANRFTDRAGNGNLAGELRLANEVKYAWAVVAGGLGRDEGRVVGVDEVGNVTVAGTFSGTADFDPGVGVQNITSSGGRDVFVQKLDARGGVLWTRTFGGPGEEEVRGMAQDAAGNVYLAGSFFGEVDFDPGLGVRKLGASGESDLYVTKLSGAGELVWAHALGGATHEQATGLAVGAAGEVYLTGFFSGELDVDPGPGQSKVTAAPGQTDSFVAKFDAGGQLGWAKGLGVPSGHAALVAVGAGTDAAGGLYILGAALPASATFDRAAGVGGLTVQAGMEVILYKLDAQGGNGWSRRWSGTAGVLGRALAVGSGSILVAGNYRGEMDGDPGVGERLLGSEGGVEGF
ncbi:MAG: hypothetical protein FJ381_12630, partial [Verrucomicrobia bacterium]|nr:hypothetical protein [Verrucomicrobiota bacterium]